MPTLDQLGPTDYSELSTLNVAIVIKQRHVDNAKNILANLQKTGSAGGRCLDVGVVSMIDKNHCRVCRSINPEMTAGSRCPCYLNNITLGQHIERLTKFIKDNTNA